MEFSVLTHAGDAATGTPDVTKVIFSTHRKDVADETPLQMVSAEQVAYWRRIEVEYLRLLGQLAEVVNCKPP